MILFKFSHNHRMIRCLFIFWSKRNQIDSRWLFSESPPICGYRWPRPLCLPPICKTRLSLPVDIITIINITIITNINTIIIVAIVIIINTIIIIISFVRADLHFLSTQTGQTCFPVFSLFLVFFVFCILPLFSFFSCRFLGIFLLAFTLLDLYPCLLNQESDGQNICKLRRTIKLN